MPDIASPIRVQPGRERRRAELLGRRGPVQQLADVAHIRQPSLAVGVGEHPGRQVLADGDRLQQCRYAPGAQDARPVVQPPVDFLPLPAVIVGARVGEPLRRPPEKAGERRRVRPRHRGRALERLDQAQPFARDVGSEHAPGAVDDRRNADIVERLADHRRLPVGPHEDRQMAGADDLIVDPSLCAQQRDDIAGQVIGDELLCRGLLGEPPWRQRQIATLTHRHAEAHRRLGGRAREA
jgi:hypothetical protein